jgi:hypothetical protein
LEPLAPRLGNDVCVKRWALAVVMSSLLALGACNSSGDDAKKSSNANPGAAAPAGQTKPGKLPDPHFAVFPDKVPAAGWELTEAVRELGTGREVQLGGLPGVDWYAEFDGPPVAGGANAYLSLTGYTQSLDERKEESVSETSTVNQGQINGHDAFWSIDPQDPDAGAVVTWTVADDYTIEVYGTGLSMDQLLAFARTVKDATQDEWIAAGGKLSDCSGDATCPDNADG